jgi:glycosyltransferase involved in cell wall biosynthesis
MNNPKISILIPLYNHEEFIEQTLNSVLEDEYLNKEIIIINDGSTDKSDNIVKQWIYKNKNNIEIKYIYRENKGLHYTLNELYELSSGKYIINIASDDYLINNTLKKRVELLESNPNKLMLIADCIVVDNKNNIVYNSASFELHHGIKDNYFDDKTLRKEILYNWATVGPSYMLNRKIYDVIGFYDSSIYLEDWDFAVRAISKDLILFFDEKVAAYRLHQNNTIKNKDAAIKFSQSCIDTIHKHSNKFGIIDRVYLWNKARRLKRKINMLEKYKNEY